MQWTRWKLTGCWRILPSWHDGRDDAWDDARNDGWDGSSDYGVQSRTDAVDAANVRSADGAVHAVVSI